jgi:hypothetical protein
MCRNTTQLEQKIESLVTLLSSTRGIAPSLDQISPPESQGQSEPSPSTTLESTANPEQRWAPELPIRSDWICAPATDFPFSQPSISPYSVDPVPASLLPYSDDSDHLLDLFRDKFAPNFPFVIIPPNITATQ